MLSVIFRKLEKSGCFLLLIIKKKIENIFSEFDEICVFDTCSSGREK